MRLHDTLSGELVELRAATADDPIRLYVCGITPYSASHIGHGATAIVFDVLRRYLDFRGYPVRHITNFTDIDDKLIDRANASGTTVEALATKFSDEYLESLKRLNVLRAALYPRATQEIPEILAIIEGLVANGAAYPSGGDVYYRVRRKADYGKLSGRDIDELLSGARIDPTEHKEDPLDFALWKGAKPGEPSWESPWGPGRPGWHIECSAMAWHHLGEQIDIHGGGADLIFPHHENEIAQSESFTGKPPFARTWMHVALLKIGGEKMAKSAGNIIGLDEAIDRHGADALRLFIVGSHYRTPVTYSPEALEGANAGVDRLREAATAAPLAGADPAAEAAADTAQAAAARAAFIEAMDEDLNTARGLATLFDLVRAVNRARDERRAFGAMQGALRELAGVLGFTLAAAEAGGAAPFIDLLVQLRAELRGAKQWALADRVRNGLAELGVEVKDGPEGTTWSVG